MTEKKMFYWEAAREILREAGGPLHYREITRMAIEQGLIKPSPTAKTPEQTLGREMREKPIIFIMAGDGHYDLVYRQESIRDPQISRIIEIVTNHKQVILYGPPGTSKTWYARISANEIADTKRHAESSESEDEWRNRHVKLVQFHPSYSYDGFVEGIFPILEDSDLSSSSSKAGHDRVGFVLKDRIFKTVCKDAEMNPHENFVIVIDEINRADLSSVFGEIFSILEYRSQDVMLHYSEEPFQIPENIYMIGTMNTLDKSTIDIDYALMRRFRFIEVSPDESVLQTMLEQNGADDALTTEIVKRFKRTQSQFQLGHAYFKDVATREDLKSLWDTQLSFMLEQYFGELRRPTYEAVAEIWEELVS